MPLTELEYGTNLFTGGSSILILRNDVNGSNSYFFNRSWAEFKQDFGSPTSRYWIGLDRLHEVSQGNCKIRFNLQLLNGSSGFAQYSNFSVGGPSSNYTLTIGGYSGNLGDAMGYHNGRQFTTYDVTNDEYHIQGNRRSNCASSHGGGFWFKYCAFAQITVRDCFCWYSGSANVQLSSVEVRLWC